MLRALREAAGRIRAALARQADWGPSGGHEGQYKSDLVADAAALPVLEAAGFGVLSEESGLHREEAPLLVALDPLDGSSNAARGIPFYAASLCALDAGGPRAALVENLVSGARYEAVRGRGARRDGETIAASSCRRLSQAVLGVNGWPRRHLGWRQYRALGSAALELCAVAEGSLDGFADLDRRGLGPWDYLGGLLVCQEAGAVVGDAGGRDLVVRDATGRRSVVAAATPELMSELLGALSHDGDPGDSRKTKK